jgi:hypothetical protein
MKLPSIKKLVESYSIPQLQAAEEAILEEKQPEIEIEGSDEGEKLTHIMAAVFIIQEMQSKGLEYNAALRAYSSRVRTSIS